LALEGELAELIERRRKVANGPLVFHHDGKPIVDFRKAWMTAARMAGISGSMPTSSSSARIQARNRPAADWRSAAGVGAKIPMLLSGPGRTKRESLERLSRPRYQKQSRCLFGMAVGSAVKIAGRGFDIVDFQHLASGSTIEYSLVYGP